MASTPFELKGKTVFVAGHRGMVGSRWCAGWREEDVELLTAGRAEVDLRDQAAVYDWFAANAPQAVFLAAAKVGGIVANNTLRAEFLYDNLAIAANVIHAAHVNGAEKLMFLGSSCIYPKLAPQPLSEDCDADRAAGADQRALCDCQDRRHQDGGGLSQPVRLRLHHRDADQSLRPRRQLSSRIGHVVAALIRRFHEAKVSGADDVVVWGTGTPRRNSSMSTIWPTPAFS